MVVLYGTENYVALSLLHAASGRCFSSLFLSHSYDALWSHAREVLIMLDTDVLHADVNSMARFEPGRLVSSRAGCHLRLRLAALPRCCCPA